jgi:hypothetical protein
MDPNIVRYRAEYTFINNASLAQSYMRTGATETDIVWPDHLIHGHTMPCILHPNLWADSQTKLAPPSRLPGSEETSYAQKHAPGRKRNNPIRQLILGLGKEAHGNKT